MLDREVTGDLRTLYGPWFCLECGWVNDVEALNTVGEGEGVPF